MQGTFFNLGEGEQIIQEIKPMYRLKIYYFVPNIFLIFFASLYIYFAGRFFNISSWLTGSVIILALIISWLIAGSQYSNEYYWITNKRIIYKRGILGYQITSIPYERVSDVMISRTFTERIFGIASLHVQSLAGQVTTIGRSLGAEGSLNAIPNPEEMQELIFKLIKQKRTEEHLSF